MTALNEQLVSSLATYEKLTRNLRSIKHRVDPHRVASELNVSFEVAKALLSGSHLRLALGPKTGSTDDVTWWT